MTKIVINSKNAPKAIGTYSQAIKKDKLIFLSGQIGLDPNTMNLVDGINNQIHQVFQNLIQVINESGATIFEVVKLNVYLTNLENFSLVNEIMEEYFSEPYPARAAVGVSSLPKGAQVEVDGFVMLD
jgi:reactive intermediate/imine deaminase